MCYGSFTQELLIKVVNVYNDNTFVGSQISTKLKLGKPPFKKDKCKEHLYLQLALFPGGLYRAVTQGTQAQVLEVQIKKCQRPWQQNSQCCLATEFKKTISKIIIASNLVSKTSSVEVKTTFNFSSGARNTLSLGETCVFVSDNGMG